MAPQPAMLLLGALLLGASAYQLPARPRLPTHATRAPAPLLFQPPTPIVRNSLNGTTATKAFAVLESEWQELPGAAVLRDRFLEKSTRLEVLNAVLVFLSFSITAIYTVDGLTPLIAESLRATENVIVLSFATEFTLRWWSQSLRPSYLFNPLVLLDTPGAQCLDGSSGATTTRRRRRGMIRGCSTSRAAASARLNRPANTSATRGSAARPSG